MPHIHKNTFILLVISVVTLAMLQAVALYFSLYWTHRWLDIPMHALGGATVALGYQSRFLLKRFESTLSFDFFSTILFVLAVGLVWEVYEYGVGTPVAGLTLDSVIDIGMDMIGGTVGYIVAKSVSTYN
jgi:hypothetical protein